MQMISADNDAEDSWGSFRSIINSNIFVFAKSQLTDIQVNLEIF